MNDKQHLSFMAEAAHEAQEMARDVTRDELDSDRRTLYAVAFALSMVGEEAAHLSPEFRDRYPDVEWGVIVGMRNRLIHGYRSINTNLVWETVQISLPELIAQREQILRLENGE